MYEKPKCIRCKKKPEDIAEYRDYARMDDTTPSRWVLDNEAVGCWGEVHGPKAFYCTDCYIKAGMPLRKGYVT